MVTIPGCLCCKNVEELRVKCRAFPTTTKGIFSCQKQRETKVKGRDIKDKLRDIKDKTHGL
jgi:hypothetical protein